MLEENHLQQFVYSYSQPEAPETIKGNGGRLETEGHEGGSTQAEEEDQNTQTKFYTAVTVNL